MRANPLAGLVDVFKGALPVAVSLYGARYVSNRLLPLVPGLDGLGRHAAPVGAALIAVLGNYASKRIGFLSRRREAVMLGVGLNLVNVVLETYMPANIKAMVGMGNDEDLYDAALTGVGEYVSIGDYEAEMGEYVSIGAEEELGEYVSIGAEEELGMGQDGGAFLSNGIGTGIGSPATPGLVKAVPRRAMVAPVPARSFTKEVPAATSAFDNLSKLYTGIFAGGFGC
jgi:hypothetical protein